MAEKGVADSPAPPNFGLQDENTTSSFFKIFQITNYKKLFLPAISFVFCQLFSSNR